MKASIVRPMVLVMFVLCYTFFPGRGSVHAAGVEKDGRWLRYNGDYPYVVGIDIQRIVSWTDIDYLRTLDELQDNRINFFRIWVLPVYLSPDDPEHKHIYAYPYSRGEFDFDSWNDAFWIRLKNVVQAAKDRDIIVNVSLFNVLIARFNNFKTPFDKNDNAGAVFSPKADGDLQPEWYDLNYSENGVTLKSRQQALVDKTLAELGSYDNVIFEVQNENGHDITSVKHAIAFQNYWAKYVAARTSKLVMVHAHHGAGEHTTGIDGYWTKSYIDVLGFHFYPNRKLGTLNMVSDLLHSAQNKNKVLFDNEGWGNRVAETAAVDYWHLNASTRHNWAMFTSGGYGSFFNFSRHDDMIGDAAWDVIAQRLKTQRDIVEKLRFWEMSPVDRAGDEIDSRVTDGPGDEWQVIANLGREYLVFFCGIKRSNDVRIDLPSGVYDYAFYNTENGRVLGSGIVNGGGVRSIESPAEVSWNGEIGLALTIMLDPHFAQAAAPDACCTITP